MVTSMNKSVSIFLAGMCAGVSAALALSPSIRRDAIDALGCAQVGAWNAAATRKSAVLNSVEAAKATYAATVKSAGFQTAPMESN